MLQLFLFENEFDCPGRDLGGIVLPEENKGSFKVGLHGRECAQAVGKVDEAPEIREFPALAELRHMVENRTEIRAAEGGCRPRATNPSGPAGHLPLGKGGFCAFTTAHEFFCEVIR